MNRLIIIGNGFDMAHGLKTSYMDFINWYWDRRVDAFVGNITKVSADCLCKLTIKDDTHISCWNVFAFDNSYFKDIRGNRTCSGYELIAELQAHPDLFAVNSTKFFGTILQSIETRGWVDIENDYYQLLKECSENADCGYTVKELNEQLAYLQEKLVEYLSSISTNQYNKELHDAMITFFDPADFSTEGKKKALENMGLEDTNLEEIQNNIEEQKKLRPERIMLLSFNYTTTAKMYGNFNLEFNYIHGELEHPEKIIFGYGDELDKHYQDILDRNDNELLKNVKSVKYLETRHYHDMLEFLMSAPFQVLIMGHSCGNSDRTLLNTVFEHKNCVSIKPFYHKWDDGSDNYLELVQNISRNFTNMRLFRDRVVNKEQCKTM
ncbi:MAG: bacteriophage abortive infection AbiH family protein [Paludibacteraceae bacterium]|nr:bacteriophage abortive infection AbiH family protein [Paludibacteraceae bacterium]